MDEDDKTQSHQGLTRFSEQSQTKRLGSLKAGAEAAKVILSRYPDFGKAPVEYIANMAELLADFDPFTIKTITDKHIGITAKCKFLPAPSDVLDFVEALEAKRANLRDVRKGRVPEKPMPRPKFKPFPKLWEEFGENSPLLDGRDFEILSEASRSLAMFGRQSAQDVLSRKVGR